VIHILIFLKEKIFLIIIAFCFMFKKMSERKTKGQSDAFYSKRKNERDMEREKLRGSM
jgi:hypothetical protein